MGRAGQLSLELAEQGVRTLVAALEQSPARAAARMVRQHARRPLGAGPGEVEAALEAFGALPVVFVGAREGGGADWLLAAAEFAAHALDVRHVVVDSLQVCARVCACGCLCAYAGA